MRLQQGQQAQAGSHTPPANMYSFRGIQAQVAASQALYQGPSSCLAGVHNPSSHMLPDTNALTFLVPPDSKRNPASHLATSHNMVQLAWPVGLALAA